MEEMLLENPTVEAAEAAELPEASEDAAVTEESTEPAEESALTDEDYERMAAEDLRALKAQFPALKDLTSLSALKDPVRYGELRDLGLSPTEAYLAIGGEVRPKSDNRAHLKSAVPRIGALGATVLSAEEMAEARRLFSDLSDAQIHRLYKRVTN